MGTANAPRPLGGRTRRITGQACARPGVDPELFFHPDGERGPAKHRRDGAAIAVCATCDPTVRLACLREALSGGDIVGVWGGTTEEERRDILRRQEAKAS